MALVIKDRVKETTTTTGDGTINLAGASSGFQSFVAGVGDGNTTYYALTDANGTAWEIGIGTITDASPDTLARTTLLASSTGSKIVLTSGTHTVFGTYPAGKAVHLDASGNLSHTVDISTDTNLAAGTGITLTGDTLSTTDGDIVHDNLSGFVANEHIDWTTDQGSTNIHAGNYTDTNTMGSGFTVSATTDTTATTITEGEDLFFAAGTGITCATTADGTVTISCTVTDTNTTYTKASFDLDHLFTLVGATADTSENLGTFTGSTIADSQTIKAAIQAVETAVETKGVTAGSSSIVTVGTISSGTWQGTAIAQAYIANDAINGDKIADDAVNSEHYAAGSIDEEHLNATNSPTENYLLSYDDASGGFTWVAAGSGGENNEYSFKTISVSGQDDVVADTTTDTLTLAAGSNVTITTTAASDTVTIAATDTNTQLSQEQVEDFVGGMLGGTETLITVTYQDGTGDIDFVVDNDLSNYDNSSSGFITATLTEEQVEDFVGGMLGGTETGIAVTYQDGTGDIDFVVSDTTVAGDSGSTGITPGDTLTIAGGTNVTTAMSGDTLTVTATDTNTTYTGGTNLTLDGTTFNVDDAFLKNDASDSTTGTITAGGFTTAGTLTVDSVGISTIQSSGESFADNDTSLMTSAAIDDRINSAVANEDTLAELNDTNISSAAAGHLIIYDNTASVWDNAALTAGSNISITNGDGAITIAATDTNTTYTGGTNLTLAGTTFNVDDAFLINSGDDTTTGVITAGGFTTTGTWTFDEFTSGTIGITTVQDSGTTFDDNDTSLMTAAAIADKIEAYGYSTTAGDITGVTAGTGLSGGGASGAVTLNVDASQTQITAVGTIGTGIWQGTAIATAYIADDAITGAKIALFDDSLAATTTHFLIADGTDYSSFALSGDVTCTNGGAVTVAADAITYAKMQNVSADERILGRVSGADGVIEELTKAQVLTFANVEDGADVTDTTNVTSAGALMDSEVTNLAFVKALAKGISDGNVLTANDAVADDDFLRINGTEVEGLTVAEVLTALNVEAAADVTDTANVTSAGALMDSELTDLAGVKGVTISTLQVKPSEGAFANGDKTKLDAIEASADVTDTTNVTAAGALMDSEVTNLATVKALATGISDGNFLTANDAVADNDFLRIDGTEVEGRTASEVLSDIAAAPAAGSSSIVTVGTVGTGTWQGTAIATAYIADDAVTGAKIALFDDSLAATTTHFLIADGTDYSSFALSGDVTCTNGGVVSIADDVISSAELADACTAVTSFTAPLIEGSTSVQTPLIEYTDGDNAITINDGGSVTFAKSINQGIATSAEDPEDDVTLDINLSDGNYFEIDLGSNITDIDFTNGTVGQRFIIRFQQHASSGPYTLAWNAVTLDTTAVTVSWPGGTAPTMTATDDKADTYGFIIRTADDMDGYVIGQNITETTN